MPTPTITDLLALAPTVAPPGANLPAYMTPSIAANQAREAEASALLAYQNARPLHQHQIGCLVDEAWGFIQAVRWHRQDAPARLMRAEVARSTMEGFARLHYQHVEKNRAAAGH